MSQRHLAIIKMQANVFCLPRDAIYAPAFERFR